MNIADELSELVATVAKSTGRPLEDVWFDIDTCTTRERGMAYAIWPLVKARYHDKGKHLDKWLEDAYGCFCAFCSITELAVDAQGEALKALTITATIGGNLESLSSESVRTHADGEARVSARLKSLKARNDEIERVFSVFSEPRVRGGKRPKLTEVYPMVAEHLNRNGWVDGGEKIVPSKNRPITSRIIKDVVGTKDKPD